MDQQKLARIVERKNERLEEDALRQAEELITNIVAEQQRIKVAETRIAEYREQLAALEVQQLDRAAILGG